MATTVNAGQEFDIWNFTLSSTADTAIVLNRKVNSITIRCRSSIDLYLRSGGGANDYFTIPSGSTFNLDINTGTLTPFYLRSASSTPVAEILATF